MPSYSPALHGPLVEEMHLIDPGNGLQIQDEPPVATLPELRAPVGPLTSKVVVEGVRSLVTYFSTANPFAAKSVAVPFHRAWWFVNLKQLEDWWTMFAINSMKANTSSYPTTKTISPFVKQKFLFKPVRQNKHLNFE